MAVHFGQTLQERRRQMGLSIQQVANTIKIRPQIVEFFEAEDFASMPPRGYAQGMISSYARFLGLNPRQIVEAYFDGLYTYEHSGAGVSGNYQMPASEPNTRGSNPRGRYFMVQGPTSAGSRYAQRPPQAGYVAETSENEGRYRGRDLRARPSTRGAGAQGRGRRPRGNPGMAGAANRLDATTRMEHLASGADLPALTRAHDPSGRPRPQGAGSRPQGARGPQSPRSRQGRRPQGSRSGAVPPRGRGSGRGAAPSGFQLDPRLLLGIIAALLLVIILLAFSAVRGCTSGSQADQSSGSTTKVQPAGSGDTSNGSASDASSDDAQGQASDGDSADGSDASGGQQADAAPQQVKVKVKIKTTGVVAFLEVKLDGKSVLGKDEVGPFEQEFNVTQSIEITTDKPSDVVVYKNGERVRYDMKTSGVAKVTITLSKEEQESIAAAQQAAAGGQTADGQATADGHASTTGQAAGASSTTSTDTAAATGQSQAQQ